jgi:lycopene beta-cyclase
MTNNNNDYDYIICGAGCAGLSLAYRLCDDYFSDKKILLINKDVKNVNDRTWSFWTDVPHLFDAIVYKRWSKINFYGHNDLPELATSPYTYQMIRGIDFYNFTLEKINSCQHIDIKYENIEDIADSTSGVTVTTSSGCYRARQAFDSIVKKYPIEDKLFVWQHFKGWVIECPDDQFDKDVATFMDFRIDQEDDIRFVYVLPHSPRRALIEATIFSKTIGDSDFYDKLLKNYCEKYLKLKSYSITDEEMGAIPMTTAKFPKTVSSNIIPIGTLNDTVKPSSGYAFTRIQKESEEIYGQLKRDGKSKGSAKNKKFIAYDKTFLNVLLTKKESGRRVFSLFFERNSVKQIFKFLDEKTSILEEINLFKTLPIWSFTKAFIEENMSRKT